MGEVTLTGWFRAPPAALDRVRPLLAEHIRLTLAEPGCLAFSVEETPPGSGRFAVAERFRDRAAFEAHQARASASAWGEATRGMPREYSVSEAPA